MIDASIDAIDVSVYTVPTDAPEADGTLAWDSDTMVLVTARSGAQPRTVSRGPP